MAEDNKLSQRELGYGKLYQLTEDLEREIMVGGQMTYKVFPAGTIVRTTQIHPWIQVATVDENGNNTDEQFAVALYMIDKIYDQNRAEQLNMAEAA